MKDKASVFKFYSSEVALFALLNAFRIGKQERVLMPAYINIAVPRAVEYAGGIPEYADIDPASYNSRLSDYKTTYRRMEAQGTSASLSAVIIKHTYGNPNRETEAIIEWAKNKRLIVIEDCSQTCGGTIDGIPLGFFGDGAFFSTGWGRPLCTGAGGIARANNAYTADIMAAIELAALPPALSQSLALAGAMLINSLLQRLRLSWWLTGKPAGSEVIIAKDPQSQQAGMPVNYFKGMHKIQRYYLEEKIKGMDKITDTCIALTAIYDKVLAKRGLPLFAYESGSALIRYPLRLKSLAGLPWTAPVPALIQDRLNNLAVLAKDELNWEAAFFPNTMAACREVVTLPVFPWLAAGDVEQILDELMYAGDKKRKSGMVGVVSGVGNCPSS